MESKKTMRALFQRFTAIFSASMPKNALYDAIVAAGRDVRLYREKWVPDTLDGRFDAILLVFCLVLLRLEQEGEATRLERGALLEQFIDDMDANIRELGVGDLSVGRHVKNMAGALSGRMEAYRAALAPDGEPTLLTQALKRNLWRGNAVPETLVRAMAQAVEQQHKALSKQPIDRLIPALRQDFWQPLTLLEKEI
jgi:cytochrome b pre-mRNA-processing protein 3